MCSSEAFERAGKITAYKLIFDDAQIGLFYLNRIIMSHWNHRVLVHQTDNELFYIIHEVHYDEMGIPHSYTENGVPACGESIEEITWVLNMFREALKKPVLWSGEKFPLEYKG